MKLAVFLVGPPNAGKSTIANILADLSESIPQPRPTNGVRILEFERSIVLQDGRKAQAKVLNAKVELWDTSGDDRFLPHWAALSSAAQAAVFVYSADSKNDKDLEKWAKSFPNVKETQMLVIGHKLSGNPSSSKPRLGKPLSKAPFQATSNQDPHSIKNAFDMLLQTAAAAVSAEESQMFGGATP
ncbi:hypothetical protein SeMB42_g06042 [Synchytrium endobioticum]|uniref:G domain-containing protein n=1 Tax=Synchytrium endobioticum TaxID=286115 RepID=A0A507CL33_9FUNG|nr:hypothetical protein SeMB42_g06042 [Synchytrium endobioticum]TPX44199.1 hypothetical protein SeLEV6574_g04643 [Synchytrium endobioticum]